MNRYTAIRYTSALLFLALSSGAQAQVGASVGLLSCDVSTGIGLIIEQKQKLACEFTPSDGPVQSYVGVIREFGIELGEVKSAHLTWTVLSATTGVAEGALAGTYVGADASVAAGNGAGVNLLVGGSGRSFTLQPLSVEGERGTAIAAGVETLDLTLAN